MSILNAHKPKENARAEELREEMLNGSKFVKYSLNIPRKLHTAFRQKAFLANTDMKNVLLEAIQRYLKE